MSSREWMERALFLAMRGRGKTSPNPMVGAVIVKDGQVIGEGFHAAAGGPHAEIEALRMAGERARDSEIYVTLEPCSHFGKTPPCTDALLKAGIQKVTAAMIDPNPALNGRGIEILKKTGIETEVGLLENEARKLNEIFIKWITTRLPFVTLKAAISLDGKMVTLPGQSHWITSEESRQKGREMRSWHDAILVGIKTILKDDPMLTTRIPSARNPIRIVLDSSARTPVNAEAIRTQAVAPTWIVTTGKNKNRETALQKAGASVIRLPEKDGKVDLHALCNYLAEKNVTSVLVEGGAEVHRSFLKSGLVDKVAYFIAPKIFGDGVAPVLQLQEVQVTQIGEDILIEGKKV